MTDPEGGAGSGALSTDYDSLPYLSLPIAYTQPAQLAALAQLHGLRPPSPDRARVLELGCASGGNLLPMAARWPEARFVGVDLSQRQITDGNRRIARLGLGNIKLVAGDIAELQFSQNSFDYVICHGVYSWVPPAVQAAIFRLAGTCLTDGGIAAISYNVLPGWHLRSPIRDILMSAAGTAGTANERVARARAALAEIGSQAGGDLYGSLLKGEAARMAKMPSSYIHGEFLSAFNLPTTFSDFTARAAAHGLSFLCEADFDAGALALLGPQARKRIADMMTQDRAAACQQLDLVSGRPFRRSLMVRSGGTVAPHRLDANRLAGLHIACRLTPDPERTSGQRIAFKDRRGQHVATADAAFGRVLARLGEAYPSTLPIADLISMGAEPNRTARGLLKLIEEGRALVTAHPVIATSEADPKPFAWAFARQEAALGLPYVTSLHHVTVHVPRIATALIPLLDGTRDRAALATWLASHILGGRVELPDGTRPADAAEAHAQAEMHVAETLRHLAATAVLTTPP